MNNLQQDIETVFDGLENGIRRETIDSLIRSFPFAQMLSEKGINKAIRNGFDFTEIIPEPVAKQFRKEWDKKNYNRSIIDLVAGSIQYGAYCLTINQYGEETENCLDKKKLYCTDYFINAVPPLFTTGTFSKVVMPLHKGFNSEPVRVTVSGVKFHASRGRAFYNPFVKQKWAEYNPATYGFTPMSSFHTVLPYLCNLMKANDATREVINKAGLLVHKKQGGENQAGAMPTIANKQMTFINRLRAIMFKRARGENLATIQKDESLDQINQQHTADTLETAIKQQINFIAASMPDGIPAHILSNEMLSSGLNEGGADLEKEYQWIEGYQDAIGGLINYLIEICFYASITPDFYLEFQLNNKEWLNKSRLSFIQWCIEKCEWTWNDLRKETKKDRLDSATQSVKIQLDILDRALTAGFGKETISTLFNDVVLNANKTNVFSENMTFNLAAAIDELKQSEQQESEENPLEPVQSPLGSDAISLSNLQG
jgi:hypothetical protein